MTTVVALAITHERPSWRVWLYEQLRAQRHTLEAVGFKYKAILVDSSEVPMASNELVQVYHSPELPGIAAKRNLALRAMKDLRPDYFAWFDDDDWSHPVRLLEGVSALERQPAYWACGNVRGHFINARTLKSAPHHSHEPLIFNSAVYRYGNPPKFPDVATGEDTIWNWAYLGERSYLVTSVTLGAWLCHGTNVTNRDSAHLFDRPFPPKLSRFLPEFERNPVRKP